MSKYFYPIEDKRVMANSLAMHLLIFRVNDPFVNYCGQNTITGDCYIKFNENSFTVHITAKTKIFFALQTYPDKTFCEIINCSTLTVQEMIEWADSIATRQMINPVKTADIMSLYINEDDTEFSEIITPVIVKSWDKSYNEGDYINITSK